MNPIQQAIEAEDIRAAGGIVHSDGNIFFTNIDQLRAAVAAALGRGAVPQITPAQAMDALKEAFVADPSYAWAWHCGVWAAAHDEGMETSAANRAAARLMSMAFDVDTSKHENFAATQAAAPSPEGTQPTQAETASVTTSQTVDELIAYAAQEREKDAEWQQWVERGGYDGDQQAEAQTQRLYAPDFGPCPAISRGDPEAAWSHGCLTGYRAALATQQAVQGEPVAFEFYNPTTGHAIVDYSRQTHVGPLTKEMGYEARALGYINPPPAAVKPGDPVPLWQALEALDSLEESSRGDAPYNHFAAGLVRSALEQSATPPAPGQVERDREDGFETVLVKNFGPLIVALDRAERKGYLPDALADEWAAFELRAARSSKGGGNEHSR